MPSRTAIAFFIIGGFLCWYLPVMSDSAMRMFYVFVVFMLVDISMNIYRMFVSQLRTHIAINQLTLFLLTKYHRDNAFIATVCGKEMGEAVKIEALEKMVNTMTDNIASEMNPLVKKEEK